MQSVKLKPADLLALDVYEWELETRGAKAPDFGAWQRRNRPNFDWESPHFDLMHSELDAVTRGEVPRLLIEVAIRHGKTETLTGYMAYRIHRDHRTRILFGSYKERQAHKVSRDVQRLVREVDVPLDKAADGEWTTEEGGGLLAVGAGSGVASVNADLIVIDDPIGSRAEAESLAHRDRVWDWVTTDILARATPGTQVVFSMPRWHRDDPSGRMQDRHRGRWKLISLPGEAEEDDPLRRKPGELLWPGHRPRDWVENLRVELGSYGFASAFQCRPRPREGGMFRYAWLEPHIVDAVPAQVRARVRYWDTAGTDGDGDYTAGVRVALGYDDLYYIEDVTRGQWAPGQRDRMIEQVSRADAQLGGPYEVGLEQDAGVGGKDRTRAIVARLAGLSVYSERPTGDKRVRADPVASQMEVGNVRIVSGDWVPSYLDELLDFPESAHDDQVDATSGAFSRLARSAGRMEILESVRF